MNKVTVHLSKNPILYFRVMFNLHKFTPILNSTPYATAVDSLDAFTVELLNRHRTRSKGFDINNLSLRYFMATENPPKEVSQMTTEEIDTAAIENMSKNKDKKMIQFLTECLKAGKCISDITLKKLLTNYSITGRPDIVETLQKYCLTVDPNAYNRNGEYLHYLAKSQCMKGNSEKGLAILLNCYTQYEGLRSTYRIFFRDLIQDSVLNRSEASLVIFKKYVLRFSEEFRDHYPLVCFWHLCWSSSWFSDQVLSNELLAVSKTLQNIIQERATAFSITILRQEFNDDAVVRLLQTLLKYEMKDEYVKVLHILFNFKLKNRDIRGCTEIIRNCEVLGVVLPSYQQGRYIKMLIDGKHADNKQTATKPPFKNFKLKF